MLLDRLKEELGFLSKKSSRELATVNVDERKYSVTCKCGNDMRVRMKHFGRMCRCTKCDYPIFVTYENVSPPVHPMDRNELRFFNEIEEIPLEWLDGDLLMEQYEVRRKLGGGGMGVVYKVFHRGWGVHLAVKSPKIVPKASRQWVETFEHECETWINLAPHPNACTAYYVRRLGGIPRVFIEYVRGKDLEHLIANKDLYEGGHYESLKRMLDLAIQFAWGLQHAHRQGVVHRDVKPSNLLIGKDWQAKVPDCGLANVLKLDGMADLPQVGTRRRTSSVRGGTRVYRSPDPLDSSSMAHKSDMWSFGVSLAEMFAGEVCWKKGEDCHGAIEWIAVHGPRDQNVPRIPTEIRDLLRKCFQPKPEDRPESMAQVADELIGIYKHVSGETYPREAPKSSALSCDVLNNRAVSLLDLGRETEAQALWTQVLEKDPDHLEARYNVKLNQWRHGMLTDADLLEHLLRVRATRTEDWRPSYLAARILMERGDCTRAIEILETIPRKEEEIREATFALAMAQNMRKRDKRLVWKCASGSPMVTAVTLSADGWYAFTAGSDGRVRKWEVSSGKIAREYEGHRGRVFSLFLSHDEKQLVSAGGDYLIKIWNTLTGECTKTFVGHGDVVRQAALTNDGKFLLSASRDQTLKLWNVATGECVRTLTGHQSSVHALAFSGCGRFALSGSRDQTVRLWNVETGRCLQVLDANRRAVCAIYMTRDRTRAITCSGRKIKLWSLENGALLRSTRGHEHEVHSIAYDESRGYALSGTERGTLKIWNMATGQCLRSLPGYAPAALSRDGRFAISGGPTGEFCVWAVYLNDSPYAAPYQICRDEALTG